MILIINNNSQNNIYLALAEGEKIMAEKNFASDNFHRDNLLKLADQLLKSRQKKAKDIKAIIVNLGPGSYTGLRTAMLLANTWAYVNKIPLYGFLDKDFKKQKILSAIKKIKGKVFLEPHYGAPPKITKPK